MRFHQNHSTEDTLKSKLHRSASYSEISPRKQLAIKEQLHAASSNNTLFRQYSCEELKFIPGTSFQYSHRVVSEIFVDLKSDTTFKMPKKPSYNRPIRKKRLELSIKDIEKKSALRSLKRVMWIVLPLLVVLFSVVGTQIALYNKACEVTMNVKTFEYFLSSNIFGQDKAVKKIVDSLTEVYSTEQPTLKVLIFTGPTGVGKTYTASLLEELFPWSHNIHHWIMPIDLETVSRDSFRKFPFCGDHLVIVDDLTDVNIGDAVYIANYLKSHVEEKNIIATFIFKLHKQFSDVPENYLATQLSELKSNFTYHGIIPEIIHFKTLEEKDVIQCIKEALTRRWLPVTDHSVQKVLEQIHYEQEGCKRISSKLAVLDDLWIRDL